MSGEYGERVRIAGMLTIWRRHTEMCPHRTKGRAYLKCNCPLWADGYVNGKRTLRQSLETRDLARARKKAVALEAPEEGVFKPVPEAVKSFLDHCQSEGLQFSTYRKYRNTLNHLEAFCAEHGIDAVRELSMDALDKFRGGRELKPVTASKELQLLRQFCGFCMDRRWTAENAAKRIKPPRNIKPNDVEPFSSAEVGKIIDACGEIGRTSYERLRARAMVLTLRYTALRIGDVAMLARDRISRDGNRWRIFLRTEKSGKPVFLPIPPELKAVLDALPLPRNSADEPKWFFWNGVTSERAMKGIAERTLAAVFKKSGVAHAHAHRFRHTLATELLGRGATFEDVADILGNSPEIVRKHYGKWSPARQARIDDLMQKVHAGTDWTIPEKPSTVQ
jgi:site-specific recombinase XerD